MTRITPIIENGIGSKLEGAHSDAPPPAQPAVLDIWALPELAEHDGKPWKEMNRKERVWTCARNVGKLLALLLLMYLFICSLGLLADAFRLLGGKATGAVFRQSELLSNPICGLMIGVLTTVLVQSSSTSTSIVVAMVASQILSVRLAIPIIMGANIGTSMTNTLVAMGHMRDRAELRRAFAAATVHDMFNWLTVVVLLPIEIVTGYLFYLSSAIVNAMHLTQQEKPPKLLKALTEPLTKKIIQLDKKVLAALSLGEIDPYNTDKRISLIKHECAEWVSREQVLQQLNETSPVDSVAQLQTTTICHGPHLFGSVQWPDAVVGALLLVATLITLSICLFGVVKILHSALKGKLASAIRHFVHKELPGVWHHATGYIAILFGCLLTILMQSSSIVTSALTPLVGVGVLSLERMYPLTLGANIGTTCTSLLAAMASGELAKSLQIALCHLLFNISGVLLFYVVPVMRRPPINAAKALGVTTAKYRWFAVVYIVLVFFVLPLSIFGLSLAATWLLIVVLVLAALVVLAIVVLNLMQWRCAERLPALLRTWLWLPLPLRSLQPYDRLITGWMAWLPTKPIPSNANTAAAPRQCQCVRLEPDKLPNDSHSQPNGTLVINVKDDC